MPGLGGRWGGGGGRGWGVELSAKSLLPLEMPSLGLGTWPRGEGGGMGLG